MEAKTAKTIALPVPVVELTTTVEISTFANPMVPEAARLLRVVALAACASPLG